MGLKLHSQISPTPPPIPRTNTIHAVQNKNHTPQTISRSPLSLLQIIVRRRSSSRKKSEFILDAEWGFSRRSSEDELAVRLLVARGRREEVETVLDAGAEEEAGVEEGRRQ